MNSFLARIVLANARCAKMLDHKAASTWLTSVNKTILHTPGRRARLNNTRLGQGNAAPGLAAWEKIDPQDINGAQYAKVAAEHVGRAHAGECFKGLTWIAVLRNLSLLLSSLDTCLRGGVVDENLRAVSNQN